MTGRWCLRWASIHGSSSGGFVLGAAIAGLSGQSAMRVRCLSMDIEIIIECFAVWLSEEWGESCRERSSALSS
jgi:hypothetical protein